MARPLRILFKGAYYHVLNRGQGKRDIFLDKKDYNSFLKILEDTCQLYEVSIVAYCLMSNHYHLIVHTPKANLSDFMRQVNGVYTQIFNRRYKHDGPLFKGRYKAIAAQEGSYILRLIRYCHNNPVKAGVVKINSEYEYSSHNNFTKQQEKEWLKFRCLLRTQFKGEKDLKKAYTSFMNKSDKELEDFLQGKSSKAVEAIIFGDEAYVDEVKMRYLDIRGVSEDIPLSRKIKEEVLIEKIKKEIVELFKVEEKSLYTSVRGKDNVGRMLAIGLARECGRLSYPKIATLFGGISYKSAAKYYERIKKRCGENKKLKELFDYLRKRCSQVETPISQTGDK